MSPAPLWPLSPRPRLRYQCLRRKPLWFLVLLLTGTLPTWAGAARSYTVEAVIFEHLDQARLHGEIWPEEPGAPILTEAIELTPSWQPSTAHTACRPTDLACDKLGQVLDSTLTARHQAFQRLPAREYRLTDVVQRLEDSRRYRAFFHIAWRQPGLSKNQARAVHLQGSPANPPARSGSSTPMPHTQGVPGYVEGTLRLYRGHYLHVMADLVFHRIPPALEFSSRERRRAETAPRAWNIERNNPAHSQPTSLQPQPTRFRLREHRRLRAGDLHYFDNPVFGLLLQVTPYEVIRAPTSAPRQDVERLPSRSDPAPEAQEDKALE